MIPFVKYQVMTIRCVCINSKHTDFLGEKKISPPFVGGYMLHADSLNMITSHGEISNSVSVRRLYLDMEKLTAHLNRVTQKWHYHNLRSSFFLMLHTHTHWEQLKQCALRTGVHCKRDWLNSGAKQDFSGFLLGKSLLYAETNPIFLTFPA